MAKVRSKRGKKQARAAVDIRDLFQGKHTSCWKFWKDGVSSSIIGNWLDNREGARLKLVEGLRSRHEPIYFAFGTCMHWILEQVYGEKQWPTKPKLKKLVKKYEKMWLSQVVRPNKAQLDQQETVYGLAEAVSPAYFVRWAGDFKGHKYPLPTVVSSPRKWMALEGRFKVPYVFPDGQATWISGTRDGLYECTRRSIRTFDTKCLSVIKPEDILDTLPVDLQQMLYLWATIVFDKIIPDGCVKNIIRRPGYRRGTDETLQAYLGRVQKELANVEKYDHHFQRYEMDIEECEIHEWKKKYLDPIMLDMRLWWEGVTPHYPNPNTLLTKYGRCDMFAPIVWGNTSGCYVQKNVMDYQKRIV